MNPQQQQESFAAFSRGLHEIFQQWSAFRIIREHGEAYHRHAVLDELEEATLRWFEMEGEIFPDMLQEYFEHTLSERLRTELEDGSAEEVGRMLHSLYLQCIRGDFSMVRQLITSGEAIRSQSAAAPPAACQIIVDPSYGGQDSDGEGDEGDGEDLLGDEGLGEMNFMPGNAGEIQPPPECMMGGPQVEPCGPALPQEPAVQEKQKRVKKHKDKMDDDGWFTVRKGR